MINYDSFIIYTNIQNEVRTKWNGAHTVGIPLVVTFLKNYHSTVFRSLIYYFCYILFLILLLLLLFIWLYLVSLIGNGFAVCLVDMYTQQELCSQPRGLEPHGPHYGHQQPERRSRRRECAPCDSVLQFRGKC